MNIPKLLIISLVFLLSSHSIYTSHTFLQFRNDYFRIFYVYPDNSGLSQYSKTEVYRLIDNFLKRNNYKFNTDSRALDFNFVRYLTSRAYFYNGYSISKLQTINTNETEMYMLYKNNFFLVGTSQEGRREENCLLKQNFSFSNYNYNIYSQNQIQLNLDKIKSRIDEILDYA